MQCYQKIANSQTQHNKQCFRKIDNICKNICNIPIWCKFSKTAKWVLKILQNILPHQNTAVGLSTQRSGDHTIGWSLISFNNFDRNTMYLYIRNTIHTYKKLPHDQSVKLVSDTNTPKKNLIKSGICKILLLNSFSKDSFTKLANLKIFLGVVAEFYFSKKTASILRSTWQNLYLEFVIFCTPAQFLELLSIDKAGQFEDLSWGDFLGWDSVLESESENYRKVKVKVLKLDKYGKF